MVGHRRGSGRRERGVGRSEGGSLLLLLLLLLLLVVAEVWVAVDVWQEQTSIYKCTLYVKTVHQGDDSVQDSEALRRTPADAFSTATLNFVSSSGFCKYVKAPCCIASTAEGTVP